MTSQVRVLAPFALLGAALLTGAGRAEAQPTITGFPRSDQSDVSGLAVTSSDFLRMEPGSVRTFSCPVAWGVRTSGDAVGTELGAGRFILIGASDRSPGAGLQNDLLSTLVRSEGSSEARDRLEAALTAGETVTPRARAAARRLVDDLDGLLLLTGAMDPARPGYRGPSRLSGAVIAYNRLVDESSDAYLAHPPEALRAVHAVLGRMVTGAALNSGRAATAATDGGLACAVMVPVVEVPVEHPVAICVSTASGPAEVVGLLSEDGDTTTVVDGVRLPLRTGYPVAAGAEPRDDTFTMGGRQYLRFSLPREMRPGSLRAAGSSGGVGVYRSAVAGGSSIYLTAPGDCMYQEFRESREIHRVRG